MSSPFQANVPVVISGVGLRPGDFIYADSSGAVAIPQSEVREVLEEAVRVSGEDSGYIEAIKEEDLT
jgi:regulator of RNase E activity RraA